MKGLSKFLHALNVYSLFSIITDTEYCWLWSMQGLGTPPKYMLKNFCHFQLKKKIYNLHRVKKKDLTTKQENVPDK